MEALQILKFSLKQKRLNFTEGWTTAEPDMRDDHADDSPDILNNPSIGAKDGSDKVMPAISPDDEDI
jgi:hypothetical protein